MTSAGEKTQVVVERINYRECLTPVRAFYLDLAHWAVENRRAGQPGWLVRSAQRKSTGARPNANSSPEWIPGPVNAFRCCPWSCAMSPNNRPPRPLSSEPPAKSVPESRSWLRDSRWCAQSSTALGCRQSLGA